jgi:hypothetical protein
MFRPLTGFAAVLAAGFVCATAIKKEKMQPDNNRYFFITQNSATS